MKTLKCKNCDGLIEWHRGDGEFNYPKTNLEPPTLTMGCPKCRQNVVYNLRNMDNHTVDEPVVNDVECDDNEEYVSFEKVAKEGRLPEWLIKAKEATENELKKRSAVDEIHRPAHYHKGGIDVIGYAERQFSAEERKGFYRISALKYITRFEDKGQPLKDLNKAKFYVDKLIELEEGE